MATYQIDSPVFGDAEVFPGWWCFGFKADGSYFIFENHEVTQLQEFIDWLRNSGRPLVTFNGNHYDDPILTAMLRGQDPYQVSRSIIVDNVPSWNFDRDVKSVDIMRVLPGRMGLKKLGVCLGWKKLQELPIAYDKTPTPEEIEVLKKYNANDLDITEALYNEVYGELELRRKISIDYGFDVRSMGEATLAEQILLHELRASGFYKKKRELNDEAHAIVSESGGVLRVSKPFWWDSLVDESTPITADIGSTVFDARIEVTAKGTMSSKVFSGMRVQIGDRFYAMGVGGLHSVDGPGAWVADDDHRIFDIDVASYYPNIVLTNKLEPRAWAGHFLPIYADIVSRRLKAKAAGDKVTAAVLKVAANGTYGKSSDVYSSLYDPQLTANVTLLGQLGLLVLIEMLSHIEGVYVCSANTDGITVRVHVDAEEDLRNAIAKWEYETELDMEYTEYDGLYQRDVNSYIAQKTDGSVKSKGAFIDEWPDLRHLPSANIIATAVKAAIAKGTPVRDTVYDCRDLNQFVLAHVATGGFTCHQGDENLGKIVRWYVSERGTPIEKRHTDGRVQQVPRSERAVSIADLPEGLPSDLDVEWYIDQAAAALSTIARRKVPGMNLKAAKLRELGLTPALVDDSMSRAGSTWGETDFTSIGDGETLGVKTGDGVIAKVSEQGTTLFLVDDVYPSKTRDLIQRRHGFTLYYGARVPIQKLEPAWLTSEEFDQWYTNAELKKVRA